LYNGLGDKNSYYDIVMFDYLKAKKSGNGDPLRTFDEFQDYYGEVLLQGDVESTDFLKEYLFVPDALTKLRELNISQPNGVYKMRANCDTEQWGVGNLALDGSFMRDEVLMHDIPGCEHRPDEEAFFHVNADDQLCIWVQDPTSKARNEFALESIGTKKDFAVDRMFKDASIQSGSNERFALSVTTSDGVA
jgi:hypothetical protein